MRFLPQFIARALARRPTSTGHEWPRDNAWRQGSVLSFENLLSLGLVRKKDTKDKIGLVVSHDCDLAESTDQEPTLEVIVAKILTDCEGNRTHAKHPRILHFKINSPTGRVAIELVANEKQRVPKLKFSGISPAPGYSLNPSDLGTLQEWLAIRYKRASIPDGLQHLVKDIFESVAKRKDNPAAIRGFWIDFDPDEDTLGSGEIYELWISVVYDTSVSNSKELATAAAKLLEGKFKQKYFRNDKWTEVELRECVEVADTEFSLFDALTRRQFRLEYISIKYEASIGNGDT